MFRCKAKKGIKLRQGEAYYSTWAEAVGAGVHMPIFLVGDMRSFDIMERIVEEGIADCISKCRPFIREPSIVQRW